ncbi:hypothetical protein LIER_31799 [Lithospermum erythrorhizon]|uniref:Uncharacterized protein n=1 Tax=Lithospermum erythrorhizon TaxID=34254 RepID=A0AAV3RXZ0_LITER
MKTLADILLSVDVSVNEKDLVTQLYTGFPEDYISIANIISSRLPLPSFFEARSMLLNFEAQLKSFSRAFTDISFPAVFLAPRHSPSSGYSSGPRSRGSRGRFNYNYRPSRGRNNQHFSPSWRSTSILGAPPLQQAPSICQLCNKLNHSTKECQ